MNPSFRTKLWSVVAGLAFAVVLGFILIPGGTGAESVVTPDSDTELEQALENGRGLSAAFENVADTIRPSLASVRVVKELTGPQGMTGRSPFFEFFGDRFGPFSNPDQPRFQQGAGSAFVVSEDGYLLTNHHVVSDASEVEVVLGDDTYPAEIVGSDPQTDLAVLKVDKKNLVPVEMGSSEDLRVGQWVVAAGDPFGLSQSITAGIVSAKGRSRVGVTAYEDFIQTDAAINPGNSGGPLIDLEGRVIGVNTAIASRSGGYMGVGFAIPIDLAKSVMTSLIDKGRVERGWLGVTIQDLTPQLARSFDYEGIEGALVGDVQNDTPADKAGLQSGDIIVEYDGEPVDDTNELRFLVAATEPGSKVDLDVVRSGKRKTVEVEIGELEGSALGPDTSEREASPQLGMSFQTLDDETARRLGYDENPGGVVVTRVEPFSPAAKATLSVRDVILEVDGMTVENADDLRAQLRRSDLGEGVRLTVMTQGSKRFVFLVADEN